MTKQSEEFLRVGRLVNTHGVRGEVKVLADTDFPEERFQKGKKLLLQHEQMGQPVTLTVRSVRFHKNAYLIQFEEWNNINQAETYKGGTLVVPKDDLVGLDESEGEFYHHDIVGCEVVTTEGERVGKVKEILSLPSNDVWIVRTGKDDLLIPYIQEIVKDVDLNEQRITIEWMEGLGA